jgi:hypothetical protein
MDHFLGFEVPTDQLLHHQPVFPHIPGRCRERVIWLPHQNVAVFVSDSTARHRPDTPRASLDTSCDERTANIFRTSPQAFGDLAESESSVVERDSFIASCHPNSPPFFQDELCALSPFRVTNSALYGGLRSNLPAL